MRISDHRYNRDRLRLDIAMRLMHYEARTRTICEWTGLSPDRIRKLYRAYLLRRPSGDVPRKRGKAPTQPACFLKTAGISFESATLAGLFGIFGLLPVLAQGEEVARVRAAPLRPGPELGDVVLHAYDAYTQLHSPPRLSFEHAQLLLSLLRQQDQLQRCCCSRCGRLYLAEAGRIGDAICGCTPQRLGWPRRGRSG